MIFSQANLVQTGDTTKNALVESFTNAYEKVVAMAPNVLAMIVVLVVGYFLSRFIARLVTAVSEKLGLEIAAERSGLSSSMKQVGIQRSVSSIVGVLAFWMLMCLFIMAALSILNLTALSSALEQIVVTYIPKLLIATLMVVMGLLLASFIRGVVATSADRAGLTYAESLANGCYYALVVMTFMAALGQFEIKVELLNNLILIGCGGLALGFGLAFGIGGREVVGGILSGYYLRQRLHAGDHVTVAGLEGTVRDVGPVATIIETEENGLLNRHSIPNTKMLNEAVR